MHYSPVRVPTSDLGRAVATASLKLERLSASFIVDASHFFHARQPSWKWPNLTSLALTSQLLTPDESPDEAVRMLQAAADAAMKMPSLETMEIWNGGRGLAMLFRYHSPRGGPSVITWRGTWEFARRPPVVRAWERVASTRHGRGCSIVEELLDAGIVIKSHGDAIYHLKLSSLVIRPVSLRQIRMEH